MDPSGNTPLATVLDKLVDDIISRRAAEAAKPTGKGLERDPITLSRLMAQLSGTFTAEEVKASVDRLAALPRIKLIPRSGSDGTGGEILLRPHEEAAAGPWPEGSPKLER